MFKAFISVSDPVDLKPLPLTSGDCSPIKDLYTILDKLAAKFSSALRENIGSQVILNITEEGCDECAIEILGSNKECMAYSTRKYFRFTEHLQERLEEIGVTTHFNKNH